MPGAATPAQFSLDQQPPQRYRRVRRQPVGSGTEPIDVVGFFLAEPARPDPLGNCSCADEGQRQIETRAVGLPGPTQDFRHRSPGPVIVAAGKQQLGVRTGDVPTVLGVRRLGSDPRAQVGEDAFRGLQITAPQRQPAP